MSAPAIRFTVRPRFFWRQLFGKRWCHERRFSDDWSGGECRFRYGHPFPHENFAGQSWPVIAPDPAMREWAYQKALGYKQRKLDRTRVYTQRLEAALAKQKAQTADDQRYINALEAAIDPPTLSAIRSASSRRRVPSSPDPTNEDA